MPKQQWNRKHVRVSIVNALSFMLKRFFFLKVAQQEKNINTGFLFWVIMKILGKLWMESSMKEIIMCNNMHQRLSLICDMFGMYDWSTNMLALAVQVTTDTMTCNCGTSCPTKSISALFYYSFPTLTNAPNSQLVSSVFITIKRKFGNFVAHLKVLRPNNTHWKNYLHKKKNYNKLNSTL